MKKAECAAEIFSAGSCQSGCSSYRPISRMFAPAAAILPTCTGGRESQLSLSDGNFPVE